MIQSLKPADRGVSPLDRAHALRLDQKTEDALRLAGSIVTASPEDVGAAYLLARLLLDKGRAAPVGNATEALVERFVRRGDLLGACLTAQLGFEAGGFAENAISTIAEAFGKGSKRVSDVSPRPPPLPTAVEVAPFFAKLSGDALLDACEKALTRFIETKDGVPDTASLPKLPLFGELEPAVLTRLLGAFEARELKAGEYVVKQGDDGKEAFALARGVLNVVREDEARGPVVLAALGPGSIFGEMALVSDAPRAASVVAVEPAQFFSAQRKHLEALAQKEPAIGRALGSFCHGRMVSNLIRHSVILSAVEPKLRQELVGRFAPETFKTGAKLVSEGDEGGCLFLIASGTVDVRSKDAEGDAVVLAQLGPGDVVGEISLILRRPATADVIAVHQTVALKLTRDEFQQAIKQHPKLLSELYELATKREEETRSVVAQEALDVSDVVLL
ncbi:MAG TPA: cyclic nucleotide-binding domain-containing protein [Polyangiales bacterium]|nr:cyclic nucleotide-binding domain-containing protein [Polyangiales bacterium]